MTTPAPHPPDLLCDEILADGRRQADEILRRARDEAGAIVARATAEAEALRKRELDAARAAAARRGALLLATVPVETGRLRSARINELLESIREEIRRQLLARDGFDYRESLISLAAEAVRVMSGEKFTIRLSVADLAVLDEDACKEIERRVGRAPVAFLIETAPEIQAGVIVQDAEGRQIWDNRLDARLNRMWPELLRNIAVQLSLAGVT